MGAGSLEIDAMTLYANLIVRSNWSQFYEPHRKQNNPLYNDDCIYTPDVVDEGRWRMQASLRG